jgi:hypothetical protein
MLVMLTETYCNKVNIQITQRDDFIQNVDFYSKNKFEKLVHLVGFIIRTYDRARSPERETCDSLDFLNTYRSCFNNFNNFYTHI